METIGQNYRKLLHAVGNQLEQLGWTKSGTAYFLLENENFELLSFQKSNSSSPDEISFTINLGISSTALRKFFGDNLAARPQMEECHWQRRVGFLLPQHCDYWWKLNKKTSVDDLIFEISQIIYLNVMPEFQKFNSDKKLIEAWLKGYHGLTELQRFVYLTTLLKIYGDYGNLEAFVSSFMTAVKDRSIEKSAKIHLRDVGYNYAK